AVGPSIEARGAPEGQAANNEKQDQDRSQKRGWSPSDRHLRDARNGRKDHEHTASGDHQQPVQAAAGRLSFTEDLAPVHAGFDEVCGYPVAVAFPDSRLFPAGLLLAVAEENAMAPTPSIMSRDPPMT